MEFIFGWRLTEKNPPLFEFVSRQHILSEKQVQRFIECHQFFPQALISSGLVYIGENNGNIWSVSFLKRLIFLLLSEIPF